MPRGIWELVRTVLQDYVDTRDREVQYRQEIYQKQGTDRTSTRWRTLDVTYIGRRRYNKGSFIPRPRVEEWLTFTCTIQSSYPRSRSHSGRVITASVKAFSTVDGFDEAKDAAMERLWDFVEESIYSEQFDEWDTSENCSRSHHTTRRPPLRLEYQVYDDDFRTRRTSDYESVDAEWWL